MKKRTTKTIDISEENYHRLLTLKYKLTTKEGRRSFDRVITMLHKKWKSQ